MCQCAALHVASCVAPYVAVSAKLRIAEYIAVYVAYEACVGGCVIVLRCSVCCIVSCSSVLQRMSPMKPVLADGSVSSIACCSVLLCILSFSAVRCSVFSAVRFSGCVRAQDFSVNSRTNKHIDSRTQRRKRAELLPYLAATNRSIDLDCAIIAPSTCFLRVSVVVRRKKRFSRCKLKEEAHLPSNTCTHTQAPTET